jgi:hypothetical protein
MERFEDDNPKNLYVIRRKLAELRPVRGNGRYEYPVGRYTVHIYVFGIQDTPPSQPSNILAYDKIGVVLNETDKEGRTSSISLREDPLFKNYEPIQYNVIETPNGKINLSNGDDMPILQLCELIRYLHRLTNLTAFM